MELPGLSRITNVILIIMFLSGVTYAVDQISATSQCLDCHGKITPNIVSDWKLSIRCSDYGSPTRPSSRPPQVCRFHGCLCCSPGHA